jgi:beta-mannosidase
VQQRRLDLIRKYKEIFDENGLLSLSVKHISNPSIAYLPSSPISNWGKPEDFTKGDNHYWGVYHGEEWFSAYKTHVPRFASEYGFQSFPSVQTLRQYVREDDLHLDSAAMRFRQKSYKGNGLLVKYMTHEYDFVPKRFENFVMLSQIMQGNAMKIAIEAHRSSGGHCMGSLVWQLNDCWPGITWSLIDFGARPKAAWYEVKRAFQEELLNLEVNDSLMQVKLITGLPGTYENVVRFSLMDQKGKVSYSVQELIDINQVNTRWEFSPEQKPELKKQIVVAELLSEGKLIDRTIEFSAIAESHSLKKPDFSFVTLYDSLSRKLEITLSADVFVAHVNLNAIGNSTADDIIHSTISYNNFHLLPGEKKQISWILPEGTTEIQLMNLNDILRDRKPLTILTL